MPQKPWSTQFEKIVRAHLPALTDGTGLEPTAKLFDLGLNSLGMIALLVALEDEFDVTFPEADLGAETFATPAMLWGVIDRVRES
ncbi:phosphopantetheine-binding protein [Streptomyces litchfieldiae]|uniref:Phosphopantetheine-binding protein n=1 Tax=Streptomyces litchfieldiae TaxID=3075543 RepID=A0ABU2MV40_9ACTN|nr:phosphopantetheine-binding protein [Streptomyces sp. DSM 44938]MDT0345435.1 phosphopantetheine-binding protein [Streptomyces sp. DSM 44938]